MCQWAAKIIIYPEYRVVKPQKICLMKEGSCVMNYFIEYTTLGKYQAIIYAASYINPINAIKEVGSSISEKLPNGGHILFDLLLSNGDSFNRFAEAYFDGRLIKRDSISIVCLKDFSQLQHLNAHYKGRSKELNNSVLSPRERFLYYKP